MVAVLCVFVLLFGASFHFYWGLGGRIGYEASIPRRATGERLFEPPSWGAHLVGVVLLCASWMVLATAHLVPSPPPKAWVRTLVMVMSCGFIVRAVWCPPYGGFLKTVRNSAFAHYDTVLYSPLLLILGAGLLYVLRQS